MRILYLDLGMGAAGDMLAASLYELLDDDLKRSFIDKMNSLGIDGLEVCAKECSKCGITGTHMEVSVGGVIEHTHDVFDDHDHDRHGHDHHEHDHHGHDHHDHDHHDDNTHVHDHEHTHVHSDTGSIGHIIDSMPLDAKVKENAKKVYDIIAKAESRAHSVPVEQVHFHEVGTADAIADVTAVCLLVDMLGVSKIIASPVCTGFGKVRCAHGILPVPAPATAFILEGIPVYAGNIEGEMCTPTGAALLKFFVDEYSNMPPVTIIRTGYGMGQKDFEAANCVRAFLADTVSSDERVVILSCNIDDMTPEAMGFATAKLIAEGARDVYTVNIGMKKSRQGIMLNVICDTSEADRFAALMFRHTTTIGIRKIEADRYVLDRTKRSVTTSYGQVSIKECSGSGTQKRKFEYDDIARIAEENDLSVFETIDRLNGELNDRS